VQTPLEIAFHNMPSSAKLETEMRNRAEKLVALYDRITACRVSVEALHNQHKTGNLYEVHVVMTVPGRELAVSHEPRRAKQKYAHPNVRTVMRDAFKAAERQLKEYKAQLRGDVKTHEGEFVQGQVSQLPRGADYGFILTNTGGIELYFHRNSLINCDFNQLVVGQAVYYIETAGDTGPIASKVWLAGKNGAR
jgi:cold shock CspA family protein